MAHSGEDCTTRCWGLAAIIGALTFLMLLTAGDKSFAAAAVLGILAAVLLGFLFTWLFCADSKAVPAPREVTPAAPVSAPTSAAVSSGSATAAGAAGAASAVGAAAAGTALAGDGASQDVAQADPSPEPVAAADESDGQTGSRVKPSAALAGEADLDSRKGSWKYERGAEVAAEEVPAADPVPEQAATADEEPASAPAPASAADPQDARILVKPSKALAGQQDLASRKGAWRYEGPSDRAAPASAGIPDYDKDGVHEGTDEGSKPAMLDGAREGGPDNLKEIKGIGPKLEALCHSLGVYHFDQIANWTAEEVAWMDANLEGFRGRVSRDQWVDQARILAAGGDTEFSRRVDDGDVY
ncbi:hypothetical protein [Ponticoccus alexandrii]|uniref:Endonuclease n=1 Tax=Ponticoccus alexandrii TaxID=1943633 RepID=A0ABX7F8C9_9RHOB|nr:hypothetical protein [Ponticoccus alexandrii]QRF66798.1 endonuclease [Ponticoccus alexandrii]